MSLSLDPQSPQGVESPMLPDERLARSYFDALRAGEEPDANPEFGPSTWQAIARLAQAWLHHRDAAQEGRWGILEVLGKQRFPGKIREVDLLGCRWIEVEVPARPREGHFTGFDGALGYVPPHTMPGFSRLFRPAALYGVHFTTEAEVLEACSWIAWPAYDAPKPVPQPAIEPGQAIVDDDGELHAVVPAPDDERPDLIWFQGQDGDGSPTRQFIHRRRIHAVFSAIDSAGDRTLLWGEPARVRPQRGDVLDADAELEF